jgi:hypothetical protein
MHESVAPAAAGAFLLAVIYHRSFSAAVANFSPLPVTFGKWNIPVIAVNLTFPKVLPSVRTAALHKFA